MPVCSTKEGKDESVDGVGMLNNRKKMTDVCGCVVYDEVDLEIRRT
jgi:hypothetical protein